MNLLNPRSRVGAGKQLVVLVFLTEHVPLFAMLAMGLSAYLENHFKWPNLLAFATAWSLMLAIAIPWYRWAYPAIEPTLQRASNNALKVGVAVIAIVVTVLAIWSRIKRVRHRGFLGRIRCHRMAVAKTQATLNFATVTWLTPSNLATDRALSTSARRRAASSRW